MDINQMVDRVVDLSMELLIPAMLVAFAVGVVVRILLYYTIKREEWFSKEFEKRVDKFLMDESDKKELSFFIISKKMLERTYYELFEVRAYMKRRRHDHVMVLADRVFLIQQGVAWFVNDILKSIKYMKFNSEMQPRLHEVAKKTFQANPCFSRVFGIFPVGLFNDMVQLLPGLFIVGGIFGTFLGIFKALPELGAIDVSNTEGAQKIMADFVLKISFSMSTSIVGIMLSVGMALVNAGFSVQKTFVETIDRLEAALHTLWNMSGSNELPEHIPHFDEHQDPIEALAEQSLQRELAKGKGQRGEEQPTPLTSTFTPPPPNSKKAAG